VLVSIIIPAYNAAGALEQCLRACLAQTYADIEVLLVDDGSSDATPRIAQTFPVHYIRQPNRGPAAARNRGAAEARGDILAFTDADCVPERDWLERLVAAFEKGVDAVGGTYAIANPESALARMIHEEIAARHARLGREVDFLGSFNMAYRKEVFQAVGGFDESFTMASGEDNDLAYRLRQRGCRLRFVADARVAHFHPTRLAAYLRTQMWHGFWRVKLYVKHPQRIGCGDQYAGIADLVAPPLALVLLAACPVLLVSAVAAPDLFPSLGVLTALLGLVYLFLHLPLPARMAWRTGEPRMMLFVGIAALRNFARAIGMARGVGRFIIRRKTTA
jgi:GT2 family glycosyltransferase